MGGRSEVLGLLAGTGRGWSGRVGAGRVLWTGIVSVNRSRSLREGSGFPCRAAPLKYKVRPETVSAVNCYCRAESGCGL